MSTHGKKASAIGVIIALGIVFGDIGTSPLYTMNAILRGKEISEFLVLGAVSAVIWTLTMQTTIKYVIFTLNADNNGEGGIMSLFALIRRKAKWLVTFAMIGGAMLLADGLITPPITVTSSMEGLKQPLNITIMLTIAIITGIFLMQQFGTNKIGKLFGPVMFIWFVTMAIFGAMHIPEELAIFKAFNPVHGIRMLIEYPKGFWLLGAVFLCTTGAEALYSDLGHCGKHNIRAAWIFVKICLIINYLGQGAYALKQYSGKVMGNDVNLFFELFPEGIRIFGVVIATLAAIIASQALISGAFTLVSEAIKLNLWPKAKIIYPSVERGQLFIPGVNMLMWLGCVAVVLFFKESAAMEGAYGLAITITMMITTLLFVAYMYYKKYPWYIIIPFFVIYLIIEASFLIANLSKFTHGGYFSLIIGGSIFIIMYAWFRARKIKNRYVEFVRLSNYKDSILKIREDETIKKSATHLAYLTSADNKSEIEHKVMYSIINNQPMRADVYWFLHVDIMDKPYMREYEITEIEPGKMYRINFSLGFRENPRIQTMFKLILEDLNAKQEVDVLSRYPSLRALGKVGDYKFIVMEKFLVHDHGLNFFEKMVMQVYFLIKRISLSEEKAFGLNINNVILEKIPLIESPTKNLKLHRVYKGK